MSAYARFLVLGLVVFWLLLSGLWDNKLILVLGAFSVALTVYLANRIERVYSLHSVTQMLYRLPGYWLWLLIAVVKTNIDVVKRIWLPQRYPVSPVLATVPTTQKTRMGKTLYANAITLTPGTVTVRLERGGHLLIHALTEEGMIDLKTGEMDARVTEVEEGVTDPRGGES